MKFAPVILAGGSGTRFWPRSRRARAKQVLALDGDATMIQQTVARLLSVANAEDFWVITNDLLAGVIAEQLPAVSEAKILREPAARNTAPACGLAAFILARTEPDAVIGIFPSDAVVMDVARFAAVVKAGVAVAAKGENVVVLGVPPTRAETGYGYIELGEKSAASEGIEVRRVRRFTEKPDRETAEEFVASGDFVWNAGIFLWSARTLVEAMKAHCGEMAPLLEEIAAAYGTADFARVFAEVYPKCENISVDYAVLEPVSAAGEMGSNIYCLPADFGWNDLGSWAALHEHKSGAGDDAGNVIDAKDTVVIEARGNYVFAPGKAVALVGVDDLVVVETEDALLITTRARSQDVGKIVAALKKAGREELI